MKKLFLILIGLLIFRTSSFAGTPPIAVALAFQKMYPTATQVKWVKEKTKIWEAEFSLIEYKLKAKYTFAGLWIKTNKELKISDLPKAVVSEIKLQYPDWTITKAEKNEVAKKGTSYKVHFEKGVYIKVGKYRKNGYPIPYKEN